MNENNTKISVIVWMHEEENYQKECLNSLLKQALEEIEIICVYDSLCTEIKTLLDQYKELDERVKVVFQDNWDRETAWNVGAEQAQGKYVLFWDLVKAASTDTLELLYKKAEDTSADLVFFETKKINASNEKYIDQAQLQLKKKLQEKDVFSEEDLNDCIVSLETCGIESKMFRRDFLKEQKLSFPAISNSAETYFMIMGIALAGRITYVGEAAAECYVNLGGWKWNTSDHACFLNAYLSAYHELKRNDVYEKVQRGFIESFVNACYKHLEENRDRECQLEICRKIERLSAENLEIEKEAYSLFPDSAKVERVFEGSKQALLWYEKLHKANIQRSIEVLKDNMVSGELPKVSVIIPIYNVEQYLRECLDSVLSQSLSDIEIICVNDGSTDHSEDILYEYTKDRRIKIVRQRNSGVSATRNVGINHAKGKYIYFLDSDDRLAENALKEMYECAEASELDIVYCDGCSFSDDIGSEGEVEKYKGYYTRKHAYQGVFTGAALLKEFLINEEYRMQASLQLIRREYLQEQQLMFYEGIIHEDNLFNYCCMLNAKKVSHIGKPLFLRRVRAGSIVTSKVSFANVYGYFCCYMGMNEFLRGLKLESEEQKAAMEVLSRTLYNARSQYARLSEVEKCAYLGMPAEQRKFFEMYVLDLDAKNGELVKVRQAREEGVKRLQEAAREKKELDKQLLKAEIEKRNVSQKLKQVNQEKNELNQKLQKAYQQKAEIDQKLQKTYQEKSEINQKLKKTYEEKAERGVTIKKQRIEIKELRKVVAEQKQENTYLRGCVESTTYKVGKIVMFIPCSMKKIAGKIKNKLITKLKGIKRK